MMSRMPTWLAYDFGYSWPLTRGHLLVFLVAAVLAAFCWWRGWRRWTAITAVVVAIWALAGAVAMHYAIQIGEPQRLVTDAFLPSGAGRVLDLGAGSGRATVGLLLARPQATVTAVDLYQGYYGIDDNTPERLLQNATVAGVGDRVHVQVADMRQLPFGAEEFDAAMSVAAIDHLRSEGIDQTLRETARVLKPRGQLLVVSLNVDNWVRIAMPPSLHGQGYWGHSQNRERWRERLTSAGFDVADIGTRPATVYFLATRR
jgi:SAM-dependent methyltransferase